MSKEVLRGKVRADVNFNVHKGVKSIGKREHHFSSFQNLLKKITSCLKKKPWRMSGLPWWLSCKESACQGKRWGDMSSIPGWGRSPGGGNGNSLQYSCLENPMERGAGGLRFTGSHRVRHDCAHKYTHKTHAEVKYKTVQLLSHLQLFATLWTAAYTT